MSLFIAKFYSEDIETALRYVLPEAMSCRLYRRQNRVQRYLRYC